MIPKFTLTILQLLRMVLRNYTFTLRSGLAQGMRRRYGLGFKPFQPMTIDETFLATLDLGGKTVYDVGSYVGIYTLFFARAVGAYGQVVAFEPNPQNYHELRYNVQLNQLHNVATIPIGLGRVEETAELITHPIYPSRGFVARHQRAVEAQDARLRRVPIQIDTLDHLIALHNLPSPDLIKIDVEGLELDVLYGMLETIHRCQPALFIEVHYHMPELTEYLHSHQYRIYYIEGHISVDPLNPPVFNWGHLYAHISENV